MRSLTSNLKSFSFFVLTLLVGGFAATPSAGQTADLQKDELASLVSEAISSTIKQAKKRAPGNAIKGPAFLDRPSLEWVQSTHADPAVSKEDFVGALRSAHEQKGQMAGATGEVEHPIVLRNFRQEFPNLVRKSNTSSNPEKPSVAKAGITLQIGGATLNGDKAQIDINAIFNDDSPRGVGHIKVRSFLVRQNGQWKTERTKIFEAVE